MLLISLELQIEINQTWQAAFIGLISWNSFAIFLLIYSCNCSFAKFAVLVVLLRASFSPTVTINLAINCICLVWLANMKWSNYPSLYGCLHLFCSSISTLIIQLRFFGRVCTYTSSTTLKIEFNYIEAHCTNVFFFLFFFFRWAISNWCTQYEQQKR